MNQTNKNKAVLGYWNTMGLAQPLRYILAFSGIQWQDKVYYNKEQWFQQDKINLSIPLSNLPYLIFGDFKLTQSKAILHYLPKKLELADLLGKSLQDSARVDSIIEAIDHINTLYFQSLKEKEWENSKQQIYGRFKTHIDQLEAIVGPEYCLQYLTLADFRLADTIYAVVSLFPDQSNHFKKLKTITKNVYHLETIQKYLQNGVKNFFPSFINSKLMLDIKSIENWSV